MSCRLFACLIVCLFGAATAHAQLIPIPSSGSTSQLDPVQVQIANAVASDKSLTVVPFEFDPNDMNLSQSSWLTGIGCPVTSGIPTDICALGDSKDRRNEGLLLAKTGSTGNIVAAGARINGVKGMALVQLGYDLRKPLDTADPRGSHCGAGAPRFNVVIDGVNYFIGCNSPVPVQTLQGTGWIRLRWGAPLLPLMAFGPSGLVDITGKTVDSITILFDEGQDTGPDNFGLAVLDNITVNGQVVGRGPHGGR